MNNKQTKKATVDAINVMIRHADKGPSGFWVEDHEGCGNPAVFPEFEEGLKRGRLVQKEHYFCPWNTAIMYGDGHGNINTGCYHSCSIDKARYLSAQELKEILVRFKTRMENGDYDSFLTLLQAFFADFPYELNDKSERHYQVVFYLVFKLMGQFTDVEIRSARGRADAVVKTPAYIYIFEFKLNGTAEEALQQIDDKGYLIPYQADGRKLIKIGVEFSATERNISRWLP